MTALETRRAHAEDLWPSVRCHRCVSWTIPESSWSRFANQFATGTTMLTLRRTSTLLLRLAIGLLLAASTAWGQNPPAARNTGFLSKVFKDATGDHKYTVFVPRAYTPARKWPVILYLHGAGERGNDGGLPTEVGLAPLIRLREANFPFVAVFPQAEEMRERLLRGWARTTPDAQRALQILAQVEKDYSIDPKREILTGWSMGGYGTWDLAAADPKR